MSDKWYVIEKRVELPSEKKYHGLKHDSEYEKLSSEETLGVILAQVPLTDEEKARLESDEFPQVKKIYEAGYVQADVSPPFDQGKDKKDLESTGLRDLNAMRIKDAHAKGYKGSGTKVAIIDTGFDKTHYDNGFKSKIVALQDFSGSGTGPWDKDGHGTHVAGVILDNNYGVAPDAKGIIAKGLGDNGSGSYAGIIKALEWSVAQGADVVNMSLSGPGSPTSALSVAVDSAAKKGVSVVVASGNEGCGTRTSEVRTPANAEMAITVAAVDVNGNVASFSSCGSNVNVAAPGVSVESLGLNGGRARFMSGTSMASPHIAGVLCLYKNSSKRISENLLYVTARDLPTGALKVGEGLVDALAYVNKMSNRFDPKPEPEPEDPLALLPRKTRWDVVYGGQDGSLAVVTDWEFKDKFVCLPLDQATEVLSSAQVEELKRSDVSTCGSQPTLSSIMKYGWEDRKGWKICKDKGEE